MSAPQSGIFQMSGCETKKTDFMTFFLLFPSRYEVDDIDEEGKE